MAAEVTSAAEAARDAAAASRSLAATIAEQNRQRMQVAAAAALGGDHGDDEARRLQGAFPAVFPSLAMVHLHGCCRSPAEGEGSEAGSAAGAVQRVLEGLADVYAAINGRCGGGGNGASGASVAFRGICRGCPGWSFAVENARDDHCRIVEGDD